MRTAYVPAKFFRVTVLIFLPSSVKTTLEIFTPLTRAWNARAVHPVGASRRARPGVIRSPRTTCPPGLFVVAGALACAGAGVLPKAPTASTWPPTNVTSYLQFAGAVQV